MIFPASINGRCCHAALLIFAFLPAMAVSQQSGTRTVRLNSGPEMISGEIRQIAPCWVLEVQEVPYMRILASVPVSFRREGTPVLATLQIVNPLEIEECGGNNASGSGQRALSGPLFEVVAIEAMDSAPGPSRNLRLIRLDMIDFLAEHDINGQVDIARGRVIVTGITQLQGEFLRENFSTLVAVREMTVLTDLQRRTIQSGEPPPAAVFIFPESG